MDREKRKEIVSKVSAGLRKFSVRSVMVIIAVFAMIGMATAIDNGNMTIARHLREQTTAKATRPVRSLVDRTVAAGEPQMAATVLRYVYSGVQNLGLETMEYVAQSDYENYRGIGSFTIPGTRKAIRLECPGKVTAYYKTTEVKWRADTQEHVIYVTLPETIYVDNVLNEAAMSRTDKDNVLNPIREADMKSCIEELKASGLQQAEDNGIYDLVQENAKTTIEDAFSVLSNYGVSFETEASLKDEEEEVL